jgi:transcription initiation factor IIE alpha subunit
MMIHLWDTYEGDTVWCAAADPEGTHDPDESDCEKCLHQAAGYGARAAMRYATVTAGAHKDPELQAERDKAIDELSKFRDAFAKAGGFVCESCKVCCALDRARLVVGNQRWCGDCAFALAAQR